MPKIRDLTSSSSSSGWRGVWDFDDLDLSEARFRALLDAATAAPERAALLTQLARVEGLRGRFDEGEQLIDEAAALGGADAWIAIERGRLRRSSGDGEGAKPLFEAAYERALADGDGFLAGDAAHMAALVGGMEALTQRGRALGDRLGDGARYWLGPLLNNLGWARFDAGDFAGALPVFEEALAVRAADAAHPLEREVARYAVGMTRRMLGRLDEATVALEEAVGWATRAGVAAPHLHEELGECYAAAGRTEEARLQAERAAAAAGARRGLAEPAG